MALRSSGPCSWRRSHSLANERRGVRLRSYGVTKGAGPLRQGVVTVHPDVSLDSNPSPNRPPTIARSPSLASW